MKNNAHSAKSKSPLSNVFFPECILLPPSLIHFLLPFIKTHPPYPSIQCQPPYPLLLNGSIIRYKIIINNLLN